MSNLTMKQARLLIDAAKAASAVDEDESEGDRAYTPSERKKKPTEKNLRSLEDDLRRHRAILRKRGVKINKKLAAYTGSEISKRPLFGKAKRSIFKGQSNEGMESVNDLLDKARRDKSFKISNKALKTKRE